MCLSNLDVAPQSIEPVNSNEVPYLAGREFMHLSLCAEYLLLRRFEDLDSAGLSKDGQRLFTWGILEECRRRSPDPDCLLVKGSEASL